ncbi:centromere protein Q [Macrotis lagotis]|uniref:centromere protein Q n=1 Tax=Macrotis lagotis TaxID=92651 RepID=UPI003D69B574
MMPRRADADHITGTKSKQMSKSPQSKKTRKRKVDDGDTKESEKEVRQIIKQMKKQADNPRQLLQETGKNIKMKKKTLKNKITWQSFSKANKEYFEDMMDSMIQSVLRTEVKEKENTQIHLNCLKKRFLHLCETHKMKEWNSPKEVSNLCQKEMKTLETNEEYQALLQEETEKAVKATESINENIQELQEKIQKLESELVEKEEKAKKVLQIDGTKVLSLPELPKKSINAPILHEEILKSIPNQKDILKDLHVMNNSTEMKNMLTFIKEAYEKLEAS